MNWKTAAIGAALILVLAATLPFAAEGREDGPRGSPSLPEKLRKLKERKIYVEKEPDFVNLHSEQESEDGSLWFDFSLSTDYDLEISMRYGGADIDEKESRELLLRFLGLVEYQDLDGNGIFDIYSDRLVTKYPLSGSYFNSDLVSNERDWEDLDIGEGVEEIIEQFEEFQYAEGYDFGFETGFDLGFNKGLEDRGSDLDPKPRLDQHLNPYLINALFQIPWEMYKDQFEDEDDMEKPPYEVVYIYYRAYILGMDSGFSKGYEYGFHLEDYQNDYDSATRSEITTNSLSSSERENSTASVTDTDNTDDEKDSTDAALTTSNVRANIYNPDFLDKYIPEDAREGVAPNHPTYQDIIVERVYVDEDESSYEVRFSVMDSRNRFGLACTVVNDFSYVDNGYLSPGSLKVDLVMDHYPFKEEGTDLALLMDTGIITDSSKEVTLNREDVSYDETLDLATDEAMIRISTEGFSGFFSWATTAEADEETVEVGYSDYPSFFGTEWEVWDGHMEHFRGVVFSYPRATTIHHDPKLGFIEIGDENLYNITTDDVARILQGSIPVFIITSVLVAVAVAVTWKRRGR